MPISAADVNFPILTWEQANPGLVGAQKGSDLVTSLLNNIKTQMELKTYPQTLQAQLAELQAKSPLMQAQTQETLAKVPYYGAETAKTQFDVQNPLLSKTGAAGQIAALIYLKQHPELNLPASGSASVQDISNAPGVSEEDKKTAIAAKLAGGNVSVAPNIPTGISANVPVLPLSQQQQMNLSKAFPSGQQPQTLADVLEKSIGSQQGSQQARANYFNTISQAYGYRMLPISQRNGMIAQAAGMGYDPNEASNLMIQGKTLPELAVAKGFDPQNMPEPIYPASPQSINRIQMRQQALAEINTLNPKIESAIAPYSRRIAGYSPKQISEALSGTNEEDQAKFLAAMAVQPEMAGMRFRAMAGSQLGVESIREIINASMGHIKTMQSLVSPTVYKRAQEIMDDWISQGVKSANSANLRGYSQMSQATSSPAMTSQQDNVMNISEDDLQHTMKQNKLSRDEALKKIEQKYGKKIQIGGGKNIAMNTGSSNMKNQLDAISQQLEALQAQGFGGEEREE